MDLELALRQVLGQRVEDFTILQMLARAVLVYLWVLLWMRIGERRALGKHTAMDVIMGVMIGSVASRAINSNASILPTLSAVTGLVGLHWVLSFLSYHHESLGRIIKGAPIKMVVGGELCRQNMSYYHISLLDLHESIRIHGNVGKLEHVLEAQLETSGQISVVHCPQELETLLDQVEDGVKRLRLEIVNSKHSR